MSRLRGVPRDEAEARVLRMYDMLFGDRDPVAEPGTTTGTPGDWWTAFANVPDIFDHAVRGFGLYRSGRRVLDPVLRELGQTRAGWAAGSRFVFSQHCKSLRDLGAPEEKIAAVPHWAAADCFSPVERLVLAYTDCLVYDHGRVPDGLFAALREHLGDAELLELTYITALYLQHAVMSRALRTEFDDVDERVVEIPAPAGPRRPGPSPPTDG
ncbi:MAG TPA: carboxymuconolactone decarboxylase family protein [Acidimicrobiales bacterium]|nr:carboxymuconolactone decarboxylase family protein [Acidimicrobiales bacterium]